MKKRYVIVASAFDRRGNLIASATNSYKDSNSLMRYYANKLGMSEKVFNHAEVACLAKTLKVRKEVYRMTVVRLDSFGNMKNCEPCVICKAAVKDFNVKEVYFSTEKGMKKL